MALILYEHPLSPFAQKVKIALGEKGIAYESHELLGGIPPPGDFLKLSPRAEVPTLIDGDVAVFDSTIILEYIEDKWPDPALRPKTPAALARTRMIEDVMDTQFEPITWGLAEIRIFKRAQGELAHTLESRADEQLSGMYQWLTRQLGEAPWFAGETFGLADICVLPYLNGTLFSGKGPQSQSPLGRWLARANERPCVQKTMAAALASISSFSGAESLLSTGTFKREYRDHRLEWMIRSGGISVVLDGIKRNNIRFSNEMT